jgi:hypothetical protein
MTPEARATLAKELLNNQVFQGITVEMDKTYFERWIEEQDPVEREAIWQRATALREAIGVIQIMASPQAGESN